MKLLFLAVLVTACGPGAPCPKHPVVAARWQVDDGRYRAVDADWTEVTVQRTIAGVRGEAACKVRRIEPGQPSPHARLVRARAMLAIASGAGGGVEPRIEAARLGIAALADDYRPPRGMDDTGQVLLAAEDSLAHSDREGAASLFARALRGRIGQYARRYRGETECPTSAPAP